MKKLIITLLFALVSSVSYAQEHLQYKNNDINGNVDIFAQKLVFDGFELLQKINDIVMLKGEFIKDDAMVYLYSKDDNIYQIVNVIGDYKTWASIKSEYNDIVKLYNQKYGKPKKNILQFKGGYYEGNHYELLGIELNKTIRATQWDLNNGTIMMSMSYIDNKYCIMIVYQDKENSKKVDELNSKKILNDI